MRPAMIPWIIALVLSIAAGSFAPTPSSEQERDASGVATLSQASEDANLSGRTSSAPIKLPFLSWDVAGLPCQVSCLLLVECGDDHKLRRFAHGLKQGRAPPAPSAI